MTHSVDLQVLQEGVKANPNFRKAMQILAKRRRATSDTTFARIRRFLSEGGIQGCTTEELKSLLQTLEQAGAGRIVNGDRPQRARFVWSFNLQSVACAALGLPEPKRNKKDGEPGEIRRVASARQSLPRLSSPVLPVTVDQEEEVSRPAPRRDVVDADNSGLIVIRRGGSEFDLDLDKVPASALRFRRFCGKES